MAGASVLTGIARLVGRARLALHIRLASSQLYGATFTGLAPGTRKLALTYDDGPNDPYTLQLLEVLEKHDVHATFFLIGKFVEARPDIARSVVEAGHAVGNHTYSHPDLTEVSHSRLLSELGGGNCAIEDATGVSPKLFRPPFGRRNRRILSVARKCGMTTVMWRAACYDWKAKSHENIGSTLISLIHGGEVIQFHDGSHRSLGVDRSNCVEVTDEILRHYRDLGYEFVAVPEMICNGGQPVTAEMAALT
ncbi:MAG: polysaccharide deacetylase family protein [Candidatus Acidiferrales bacterium]